MAGTKRKSNTRSKRKKNRTRIFLALLVETLVILTLAVIIGWDYGLSDWMASFTTPVVKELDISGINSPAAILIQADSGKEIAGINEDQTIYPASMTKIMTTILAIEKISNRDTQVILGAEIFDRLVGQDASVAGFESGESVRVIDLLYGAMLPSGAECCLGLAKAVSGSEASFVDLMNEKAESLGMTGTHFENCIGLHSAGHYSTVHDMAILLKYAIRNKTFCEIAGSAKHSSGITNLHLSGITYYSTLFNQLPDPSVTGGTILGGKTGYTSQAGYCLASFAKIEGRKYILVTAGASGESSDLHVQDAVTIYNRLGAAAQAQKNN